MKALYITFIALVIWSCGNSEKEEPVLVDTQEHNDQIILTKTQFEVENMQLGSIAEYDFTETVVVNGMIDVPPHNKSRVTNFMGGYITKTPLLVGDQVKKGQLLVTIENTEYVALQQQFLEVAEQLNYLKNEFTRQKTLFDEQITSEKNYLKAESTYKSSLAQYNGLKKKLQMLNINPNTVLNGDFTSSINIYAPITGSVTSVNVSNGTYIGIGRQDNTSYRKITESVVRIVANPCSGFFKVSTRANDKIQIFISVDIFENSHYIFKGFFSFKFCGL